MVRKLHNPLDRRARFLFWWSVCFLLGLFVGAELQSQMPGIVIGVLAGIPIGWFASR